MQIKDLMNPSVVSIEPGSSCALAARLISRHNVGALPVRDRDGSLNERYCMWCWDGEGFAQDCTLEEMVEHCLPHMQLGGMEPETCRAYLESLLPTLERWREMP